MLNGIHCPEIYFLEKGDNCLHNEKEWIEKLAELTDAKTIPFKITLIEDIVS